MSRHILIVSEQKPRQIAVGILRERLREKDYTEDLFEKELSKHRLSSPDRGLCQELVYGIARWQMTLDWLIGRKTEGRTQKEELRVLLQLGLYQMFWLDRVPNHAAVHETVEIAKEIGFGSQAGFINAVLRSYTRERVETEKLLEDLKSSQPATGYSHPEWLYQRWLARWGAEKTAQLMELNNTPPPTFARLNSLKADAAKLVAQWETEKVKFLASNFSSLSSGESIPQTKVDALNPGTIERTISSPSPREEREGRGVAPFRSFTETGSPLSEVQGEAEGHVPLTPLSSPAASQWDWVGQGLVFQLESHPPLASLRSFKEGLFYIQDPSTLLAVSMLDPQPGQSVLDLCAAPGGKTTYIAQRMQNRGRITAQDLHEDRLALIRENCVRLGVTCAEASVAPSGIIPNPAKKFDRILVDAPCSNTGVMRRRVDLRWRIRPEEIERLRATQLDLLRQAAPRLKPGGTLIYSTCSLEPEENGEVVKQFLVEHPQFKLEQERELLPFVEGVDGAYVAKLLLAKAM
ncbi:MAG: Sun protein [Pedosphaera sp.]|nr:Sun protein [Pedosphaera sp.]